MQKAEFQFSFDRRQYTAHVSMFTPAKTPMVRVWVEAPVKPELPSRKKPRIPEPDVYIYYKHKPGELFWFDSHEGRKRAMAERIANLLLEK
ncbi:hypothetical protein GWC95_15735 [Sediminibacterium roseum]|uniref:Uncharacterized protein n=1 Tax=Sediminibacterium roseum TaxID=1978412 RepID=A0ABX0A2E7_9BACT|nr:hypothetical protein [Sediminibacterium roseum]NCI51380.1 hypothetical protein [Sediminibacterium roseum]